jgi:SAM-dependent methyltransferase
VTPIALTNPLIQRECAACHTVSDLLKRCTRCKQEWYCNQACQVKRWSEHKKVCRVQVDPAVATAASKVLPSVKNPAEKIWAQLERAASEWQGGNPSFKHIAFPKVTTRLELWDQFVEEGLQSPAPFLDLALKLSPSSTKRALDLGCGVGTTAIELCVQGWEVTAVDTSSVSTERLSEEARKNYPGKLTAIKDNLYTWAFPTNQSLIIANDIFPYLDPLKIKEVLQKACDSLEKGGVLLGSFFVERKGQLNLVNEALKAMGAWFFEDVEDISPLLKEAGFATIFCRGLDLNQSGEKTHLVFIAIK